MRHLWETGDGRVSVQVLQEYYVTTTRTLRPGPSREAARADVPDLLAWRPLTIGPPSLEGAWSIEERFGLSFWDAMIVAAAQAAGCDALLTEDLRHDTDWMGSVCSTRSERRSGIHPAT